MLKSEKKDRPTFKKTYRCAKAKNRDILASRLASEIFGTVAKKKKDCLGEIQQTGATPHTAPTISYVTPIILYFYSGLRIEAVKHFMTIVDEKLRMIFVP
jgi:hypothetical protein